MARTIITAGFLTLVIVLNGHTNDSDRISLLEQEIRDLKIRISKLEGSQSASSESPSGLPAGEGWKSVANWRKLAIGMAPSDVRKILGEPRKIDGGNVSFWYYENYGQVTFIRDKVSGWSEPDR